MNLVKRIKSTFIIDTGKSNGRKLKLIIDLLSFFKNLVIDT